MNSRHLLLPVYMAAMIFVLQAQDYSFTPDFLASSTSQEFGAAAGLEFALSADVTSRVFIDLGYSSELFGFVMAFSLNQDDKYSPDIANFPDGTLFNSYLSMDEGGLVFRGQDMELRAGRLEHHDVIDSPYSLFVSSKRLPALLANFHYENDFAFYETRWIELNSRSSVTTPAFPGGYPDRGAQLKTYGIKIDAMRFGFQDAAVYTGRSFDFEYFISPIPNYLIQYVKGTAGRPWSTGSNENDIMGAFWDWKRSETLYLDAQVLIDDMNVFGLGGTPLNPWKAAYSLGAILDTRIGRFGFHHALATKYTFGSSSDSSPDLAYAWAYYPDTRFPMADGALSPVSMEDMAIGYYNGENNIAFRVDYGNSWSGFDITSNLEFVLSGPKSPSNAWHEGGYKAGTKLFDYSLLEKKIVLDAQGSRRLGDFLAFLNVKAGVAFNALELQAPSDTPTGTLIEDNAWIWRPGMDTVYVWSLGLGLRYDIPVMNVLR